MPALMVPAPDPPEGWTWTRTGTTLQMETSTMNFRSNAEEDQFAERAASLQTWCAEHDATAYAPIVERWYVYLYERGDRVQLESYNPETGEYDYEDSEPPAYENGARIPAAEGLRSEVRGSWLYSVRVTRNPENIPTDLELVTFPEAVCSCGHVNPFQTATCRSCGELTVCHSCGNHGVTNVTVHHRDGLVGCSGCTPVCSAEGCSERCFGGFTECDTHGFRYGCEHCGRNGSCPDAEGLAELRTADGRVLCPTCRERLCSECEVVSNDDLTETMAQDGEYLSTCRPCGLKKAGGEFFDFAAELTARRLALPTLPGREMIRDCGVEIEGANVAGTHGGDYLASQLYSARLSTQDQMARGYHTRAAGFAKVERDSSVDWEMVLGPMNMAQAGDVAKLNKAVRIIRRGLREERIALDMRAGLHIHVSAERVALGKAYNLHVLWAHLEDLFYRLGSARWPFHRAILNGDHSCKLGVREAGKVEFARTYAGDRYYGLSFSNYFERMMGACECGAGRYGCFDECTCPTLKKCTFEFRIFNTTANTKKLHAYLALTQALVAKAISMPDLGKNDADEFPGLPFTMTTFKGMEPDEQQTLLGKWESRLQWIAAELPLTADELDSIRYCVDHSELAALGSDAIDAIFTTTTEEVAA